MCGLCKRDIAGLPCEVIVQVRDPDPGSASIAREIICGRCVEAIERFIVEAKAA